MNILNEKSAAKPKLYKHSNKINHLKDITKCMEVQDDIYK